MIARAVVRDLHSGAAAVRLFSSLLLVTGLAPILAPLVGGAGSGGHVVARDLRGAGGAVGAHRGGCRARAAASRCRPSGAAATAWPRRCGPCARCCATAGSSATRSPAGSPSARCSPTSRAPRSCSRASTASRRSVYSVLFAMNGLGLVAASQVNARLVGRYGPGAAAARAGCWRSPRPRWRCSWSSLVGGLGVWPVLVTDVRRSSPACLRAAQRHRARAGRPRRGGGHRVGAARASSSSWSARSRRRSSAPAGRASAVPMAVVMTVAGARRRGRGSARAGGAARDDAQSRSRRPTARAGAGWRPRSPSGSACRSSAARRCTERPRTTDEPHGRGWPVGRPAVPHRVHRRVLGTPAGHDG